MTSWTITAVLALVIVLAVVQVPLDIREHLLSRTATIGVTVLLVTILLADSWIEKSLRAAALSVLATAMVATTYWLLHRASPRSLGWGDVLLVVPLTLAVSYLSVENVLWWQLLAATSSAVHGLWSLARRTGRNIPFGPHLLFSALLVLVVSL